jgi:hypothetical protein
MNEQELRENPMHRSTTVNENVRSEFAAFALRQARCARILTFVTQPRNRQPPRDAAIISIFSR